MLRSHSKPKGWQLLSCRFGLCKHASLTATAQQTGPCPMLSQGHSPLNIRLARRASRLLPCLRAIVCAGQCWHHYSMTALPHMRYLQVQVLQVVQIECAGQRSPGGAVSEDDRVQARQLQR